MKRISTFIAILSVLVSKAQPTFQYSNTVSPSAGATATVFIGNKPGSPGSSGPGVTWNFSSLSFTAAGTASIIPPASTPFASSFPTANWAAMIATPTSTFYSYENLQPGFEDQLGDNITATGGSTYTPDPKRHLTFPFSYGGSYVDTYQCISCAPSSFTVNYDAYGTLIINGKTYNNVARIVNTFGYPYYSYYSTNPVMSIFSYDSSPSSGPTSILIETNLLSGIEESYMVKHMSVYPNPANAVVTLRNDNFMKVDFEIYDLLGKKMKENENLEQGQITKVDISTYPPGLYFIKYHDEFNNSAFTKLIVE